MKRLLGTTVGVVLAVGATAAAFALTDFSGTVNGQPDSLFAFDVGHNANGKRVVSGTIVARVDYTCDNAPNGSTGGYTSVKRFRVKHGKWSGKQNITESGLDPVLTVKGKFVDNLKARGTLRLKGVLDSGRPGAKCDTGTVHWKATRNAQPG